MIVFWILMGICIILLVVAFALNRILFRTQREVNSENCHEKYQAINERVSIQSGKNLLSAYLYRANEAKGFIIISQGMGVTSDYYLPEILRFRDEGYAVLAFDDTGYRNNRGAFNGFSQAVKDLCAAIDYGSREKLPITLLGHSMGGYCVLAVLNLINEKIDHVIAVAAFDNPQEVIRWYMNKSIEMISAPISFLLLLVQRIFFGALLNITAVSGINKTDASVLIAQGLQDEEVCPDTVAVYAKRDMIKRKNVRIITFSEGNESTHMGIIRPSKGRVNEELMQDILTLLK